MVRRILRIMAGQNLIRGMMIKQRDLFATESQESSRGYTRQVRYWLFSGVPMSTTTYHKRDAASEMVMKEDFSYDHQNRLVKHTHQLNGGPRGSSDREYLQ